MRDHSKVLFLLVKLNFNARWRLVSYAPEGLEVFAHRFGVGMVGAKGGLADNAAIGSVFEFGRFRPGPDPDACGQRNSATSQDWTFARRAAFRLADRQRPIACRNEMPLGLLPQPRLLVEYVDECPVGIKTYVIPAAHLWRFFYLCDEFCRVVGNQVYKHVFAQMLN